MNENKEKLLWEDNPFYLNYFWWVIILAILDIVGFVFAFIFGSVDQVFGITLLIVAAIAGIVIVILLIIQFVKWKSIHYSIYEDEVVLSRGIISKTKLSVQTDKIEFYQLTRTLVDRLWGTGNIKIYTGEEQEKAEAVLHDIDNVKKVEAILKEVLSA